ncbi:hypothetical protein HYT58_00315 [Candidatus Woesearchaeota archaeon]|nr:hypothetical protein [Candidatus Woesearchaeota archaeon]
MQRLRKAIKKMAAIGTGAVMLGATLTGAMALDLADYPSPFVKSGVYDASNAFVVGKAAAASDTLGGIDIASDLQFESKTCIAGSAAGAVSISGDAVEIGDGSDLYELRERAGDVRETLTEVELQGLRGGTITTDRGSTEWNQYLRFFSTELDLQFDPIVNFTENDERVEDVGDYMFIREGSNASQAFFEYELEFEEGLESDIVSGKLDDLEDEEIVILGQVYSVVDTTVDTSADDVELVMLGGAAFDTLEEGEVKTYTVGGKDYRVEVVIISDVSPETVTLNVNGEITDQLVEGETEVLKDGTLVGVSDIVSNEAGEAGSGDIVELYVGATKLLVRDNDYTDSDSAFEQRLEVDNENIEDGYVQMKANELTSTQLEIQFIKYRLQADALPGSTDLYVSAGHGVREYLDEPEGMIGSKWDIRYEGLSDTGTSIIKFEPSGDDEYNIQFENRQGQIYKVPFLTNEGNIFKYGDNDDDLVFVEGGLNTTSTTGQVADDIANQTFNIGDDDYFLLSNQKSAKFDDTAFTNVVRYGSIDTSNKEILFDDEAIGTRKFIYTRRDHASATAANNVSLSEGRFELVFSGNTYTGYIANISGDYPITVDMNGNGSIGGGNANKTALGIPFAGNRSGTGADQNGLEEIRITVNGGGIIDLGEDARVSFGYRMTNATNSSTGIAFGGALAGAMLAAGDHPDNATVKVITLSENFDENRPSTVGGTTATNENITIVFVNRTNNEVGIDRASFEAMSTPPIDLNEPDEEEDHFYGMTDYGVFIDLYDPTGGTNDAETLTIEYPLRQRGARVYVTMGETTNFD